MNPARLLLSSIAGLAAALIAFSVVYVRGDLGGVFRFLHLRGEAKRLLAAGASAEQVAAAKAKALETAQTFAAPDLASQMLPLELLVGLLVAALVWWLFGRLGQRVARNERGQESGDVQERMVRRFAYRHGGRFQLRDLSDHSPLSAEQARVVTARMLERGELRRDGEGYTLS